MSQAAVEDADQPVRQGAEGLVVGGAAGPLPRGTRTHNPRIKSAIVPAMLGILRRRESRGRPRRPPPARLVDASSCHDWCHAGSPDWTPEWLGGYSPRIDDRERAGDRASRLDATRPGT